MLRPATWTINAEDESGCSALSLGGGAFDLTVFLSVSHPQKPFTRPEFHFPATMPRGDRHGFGKACSRTARRSLREKDLAWTEPQAVHQRSVGEASRMAPRTRPAQHLGSDAPCRVLEIRRAATNRWREAWCVRAEGQQFFCAARERQLERSGLERGQKVV